MTLLTLERIESYLRCPKRHEYEHRYEVAAPPQSRSYESRRRLLRDAIFAAFEADSAARAGRIDAATTFVERNWGSYTDDSLYVADNQQRYDRTAAKRIVENYLENEGATHLENRLQHGTRNMVSVGGEFVACDVDLLVETPSRSDADYEVYRFLPNLGRRIAYGNTKREFVRKRLDGEEHRWSQVGSILRAALSIRAIERIDDYSGTVGFRYLGLGERTAPDGNVDGRRRIDVTLVQRDLSAWYRERWGDIERLLAQTVTAIQDDETEVPERWRDEIHRYSCGGCEFEPMCHSKINAEVAFR